MDTQKTAEVEETERGLDGNEFGIKQFARFMPIGKPKLKVKEDGTATLTLEYKLVDHTELISGPKTSTQIPFNVYAAFNKDKPDHFDSAVTIPPQLTLDTNSSNKITLGSAKQDLLLITNADKREHGSGLKSANATEKGAE